MNRLVYEPPSLSVDSEHGIEPNAFFAMLIVAVVVGSGMFVWIIW